MKSRYLSPTQLVLSCIRLDSHLVVPKKIMNLDWPDNDIIPGAEYELYSEVYDVLFEDLGQDIGFYTRAAADLLEPGGSILELGTGTGRLTRRLLEAGYTITGVDPSPHMLAHARERLACYGERITLVTSDAQSMKLGRRFPLAVAPFAMVSHLYTDADRLAVFRNVYDHLEPGGTFLFDDMPSWLAGATDGSSLDHFRTGQDPASGMSVRLMTNTMDVADSPLSLRYDFIDWLNADHQVARRMIVRVQFRNISLADEVALLKQAGFESIEMLGGFDGRAFCHEDLTNNSRLIFRCQRP